MSTSPRASFRPCVEGLEDRRVATNLRQSPFLELLIFNLHHQQRPVPNPSPPVVFNPGQTDTGLQLPQGSVFHPGLLDPGLFQAVVSSSTPSTSPTGFAAPAGSAFFHLDGHGNVVGAFPFPWLV